MTPRLCPACSKPVDLTNAALWGQGWVGHPTCEGTLARMYPAPAVPALQAPREDTDA